MNKTELKKLKNELESKKDEGSTNVRLRNEVHKSVKEHVEKEGGSIANFVTIATIEKLIRES